MSHKGIRKIVHFLLKYSLVRSWETVREPPAPPVPRQQPGTKYDEGTQPTFHLHPKKISDRNYELTFSIYLQKSAFFLRSLLAIWLRAHKLGIDIVTHDTGLRAPVMSKVWLQSSSKNIVNSYADGVFSILQVSAGFSRLPPTSFVICRKLTSRWSSTTPAFSTVPFWMRLSMNLTSFGCGR